MVRKFLLGFAFLSLILPLSVSAAEPKKSLSYLALPPDGETKVPAIIVVHEWWGLNDQIRKTADEFAKLGYAAFAVDLYEGKSTADPAEAHEIMRGLPEDRALKTLQDAVTFLKKQPSIDGNRIAVIGYCMGGGYALQLALAEPSLKAAVMYYGRIVTDEKRIKELKVPMLGIFGADDRGISKESVEDFKTKLDKLGKNNEIHIYEGAGHAFANPENSGYKADAAADAWEKTKIFLKQHLS